MRDNLPIYLEKTTTLKKKDIIKCIDTLKYIFDDVINISMNKIKSVNVTTTDDDSRKIIIIESFNIVEEIKCPDNYSKYLDYSTKKVDLELIHKELIPTAHITLPGIINYTLYRLYYCKVSDDDSISIFLLENE